jgi:hypothetical protein
VSLLSKSGQPADAGWRRLTELQARLRYLDQNRTASACRFTVLPVEGPSSGGIHYRGRRPVRTHYESAWIWLHPRKSRSRLYQNDPVRESPKVAKSLQNTDCRSSWETLKCVTEPGRTSEPEPPKRAQSARCGDSLEVEACRHARGLVDRHRSWGRS